MALLNEINVKGVSHPIVTDDGYYQEMTVGDAEQLVATTFTEDDAPYNFRTAGGAIDIGDRKQVEGIVGGTVAWNQKHKNFAADLSMAVEGGEYSITDGVVTFTANSSGSTHRVHRATSATQVSLVVGHKYLQEVSVKADSSCVYGVSGLNASEAMVLRITGNGTWQTRSKLFIADANNATAYIALYNFQTSDFTPIQMKAPQLFDITQMFGPTIADYIYSLEQSNAGAGIAWFKKYFPKPYYAYNAGELMSVKALRHITRGFNIWDEDWENGTFDTTTGNSITMSDQIRSKALIPIVAGATYYAGKQGGSFESGGGLWVIFYDADKNVIDRSKIPPSTYAVNGNSICINNRTFTTPAEAHYLKFYATKDYGRTYSKGSICINLSWDGERDGEYEEYVEHVYELDPDLELRGIPKLTAGNDLYYDGDVYEPDGTVTRKYAQNELSELTWTKGVSGGVTVYYARPNSSYTANADQTDVFCWCSIYRVNPSKANDFPVDGELRMWSSYAGSGQRLIIRDDSISTATELKTKLVGKGQVLSNLKTSTEESADPYNGTQIVDDFGTEEFVDAGVAAETRDVAIPVGHNSLYQPNLRAKLEMVPEAPEDEGYYVVYHHDGINEYVPLIIPQELPELPTEDGTYTLKCTVASGSATLSFESEV